MPVMGSLGRYQFKKLILTTIEGRDKYYVIVHNDEYGEFQSVLILSSFLFHLTFNHYPGALIFPYPSQTFLT